MTPASRYSATIHSIERQHMVQTQLLTPPDNREPIVDKRVLSAVLAVPRHIFVPENYRARVYSDIALPIGAEQSISQPYIMARMSELLQIEPHHRVLEIGTGSGYQAAILGQLAQEVYTIEILPELANTANKIIAGLGFANIQIRVGDGFMGWREHAPFDRIMITCAAPTLPEPLWRQLALGGRLIIPLVEMGRCQYLTVYRKTNSGGQYIDRFNRVRFVPLTRLGRRSGE